MTEQPVWSPARVYVTEEMGNETLVVLSAGRTPDHGARSGGIARRFRHAGLVSVPRRTSCIGSTRPVIGCRNDLHPPVVHGITAVQCPSTIIPGMPPRAPTWSA